MDDIKVSIIEQLHQLQMFMHRISYHGYRGGGRKHNPHRGQGRVLALLKMKPEISQKELTYLLDMSKQSLAELLTKLEASGYITREPSEEDKRILVIKLSQEGAKVADHVIQPPTEMSEILGCLTDDELKVFNESLERIISHYKEQLPDRDCEERCNAMEEFKAGYCRGHANHGHHGHHGHENGKCKRKHKGYKKHKRESYE